LVKRFGEPALVIAGSLFFTASLFASPFITPAICILGILLTGAASSIGNALNAPTLTSLASKSVSENEQGAVMGVAQCRRQSGARYWSGDRCFPDLQQRRVPRF
jgi:hypothetical protein